MIKEYMYAVVFCQVMGYARVHVLSLDLELVDHALVFSDFLPMVEMMRNKGVDHVAVIGMDTDQEYTNLVDRILYDLSFDVCDPRGFPE